MKEICHSEYKRLKNLHNEEKNLKNKDSIINVNKNLWEKFKQFKAENEKSKFRNKIIDPHKRSNNIQK